MVTVSRTNEIMIRVPSTLNASAASSPAPA